MVTKEQIIKEEIQKIIDNFKEKYAEHKKELEANTETKLVEPLFKALGWTTEDFVKQEKAQRGQKTGHADYAFKLNDKIVFFLEVKKVGIPLEKEADKQVISYALSRGIPFAVSTNFEQLKIFCVEQKKAQEEVFRIFKKPEEYVTDFNNLAFLSKESFEKGLILQQATAEKRLKTRISIDKTLLDDLMLVRGLIANDIETNYPKQYELNDKEEIIQKLLDRLIFIRRCEDIGINPDNLVLETIKRFSDDKAYFELKKTFQRYNQEYNSGLFDSKDTDCDKINLSGAVIKKLIGYLYESKDGEYVYNFDWIDADVLGQVYEQYLGKILAQTKSGKAKLKEGQAHRKEQGIYYTPTYIVDYIVKNTVGELLKEKKTNIEKIKILDPACGSGSFLIKAFDYLNEYFASKEEYKQKKIDSQGVYSIKTEILKKNLYGVDLDNKAVEITKLNLLLKAAEKRRKLPEEAELHIKQGNSLIDDEEIDGKNFFKWIGEFQEGTFDVIIGNPPWVSIKGKQKSVDMNENELNYLLQKYPCDTYMPNLYEMFIWKSLSLLKDGGFLGLIVPDRLCTNQQFINLRKHILENFSIRNILLKAPFPGIIADTVIIILEKRKTNNLIEIQEYAKTPIKIKPKSILNSADEAFLYIPRKIYDIFEKITSNKDVNLLGDIVLTTSGCGAKSSEIKSEKEKNHQIELLKGESILRYNIRKNFWFEFTDKNLSGRTRDEKKLSKKFKVLLRKTGSDLIAAFDDSGTYPEQSLYFIYTENDTQKELLMFILAILNSKLMNCYYKNFAITNRDSTPQLKNVDLDRFPIIIPENKEELTKKVEQIIKVNKIIKKFGDKQTLEKAKREEEIERLDAEIDEIVYKIYGLSKKEIELVEGSFE